MVQWDPAGRIAVVTGASSGIGAAVSRRLARLGMIVVAAARRRDRLVELAAGRPRIVPFVVDVTDTASVDAMAQYVTAEFSACHVLVNNAGVRGTAFESRDDLDAALRTLDVNLLGTVRCMAAFASLLERSAPSRVVNIASVAGKLGVGPAAYAASKFGQVGLSESTGFSWAHRGITVCQLNPGFVETEGFPQDHLRRTAAARVVTTPDVVARAVHRAIVSGTVELTVPSWYRPFVVARHVATPLYRAVAARAARSRATRG